MTLRIILSIACIGWATMVTAQQNIVMPPQPRTDLEGLIAANNCDSTLPIQPFNAWLSQMFDAQIEVQTLTPKKPGAITDDQLATAAVALAKKLNHNGYQFGRCRDDALWVITTPAPHAIQREANGNLSFSTSDFRDYCEYIALDYVAKESGRPRAIIKTPSLNRQEKYQANLTLLGDGVASLTCQPRYPKWQGPVLWYLWPIKKGPGSFVPDEELLAQDQLPHAVVLANWINTVRKKEGLNALETDHPKLQRAADELLKNQTLKHNRTVLFDLQKHLAKFDMTLIGENRVRATTPKEMAWLLWHSPRHRGLLLEKNAKYLTVVTQPLKADHLTVIVIAR